MSISLFDSYVTVCTVLCDPQSVPEYSCWVCVIVFVALCSFPYLFASVCYECWCMDMCGTVLVLVCVLQLKRCIFILIHNSPVS